MAIRDRASLTRHGQISKSASNEDEEAFAKLKALIRSAAPRTLTDLRAAIHQAFARFTPQECRNDLTAAGYEDALDDPI